jgi:hypothetical protein
MDIKEIEKTRLAHGWSSLWFITAGVGFIVAILVICFQVDSRGPHRRGAQASILASMMLAGACLYQADKSQKLSRGG